MRIAMMGMALCAVATPAWAQRALETPAGGVRLELVAGWDRPIARLQLRASDGTQTVSEEVTAGKSGISYGGEIGYDVATSSATFIGGYAGLGGATAETCSPRGEAERTCVRTGRNLMLGLRAGIMSRGVAFYAKGGWSNGQFIGDYRNAEAPALNGRESETLDGFHVGLGLQARLAGRAYAKIEYLFTSYNGVEGAAAEAGYRVDGKLDVDRHQISGGLGVRF